MRCIWRVLGAEEKCEKCGIHIGDYPVIIGEFLVKGGIKVEKFYVVCL